MDKSLELHTADLRWLILILVRVELSRTDIQLYVASHPDAPVKITPLKSHLNNDGREETPSA